MIQSDRPSCLNCGGLMEPAVPWRCKCEDALARAAMELAEATDEKMTALGDSSSGGYRRYEIACSKENQSLAAYRKERARRRP